MSYLRPHTLDDALIARARQPARVICGGTDCYAEPAGAAHTPTWLDLSAIPALRGLTEHPDGTIQIGAATTWGAIARTSALPRSLREAAASIGTRQIRVQASIGGNLCHAAPIADGVPPLLSLDAQVALSSVRGVRHLPLDQFLLGRRQTALAPDELLTAVLLPAPRADERSAFLKFGNRDGNALAVVSVAVRLRWRAADTLSGASVVVGGASPVAVRMRTLQARLEGQRTRDLLTVVRDTALPELTPIDDCRGSEAVRLHLARVAIERACQRCLEGANDVAAA